MQMNEAENTPQQAEEHLRLQQASELRYRRLFESAKDGILILDAVSGQIVDVNPFLIEMLGYSKEDLMGKELWEIGTFKNVLASKAAFVELQEKGYVRYEDLPLETRSGATKQVEFVSNSYLVGGIRVIQCNIRDITERKRAEEQLRLQSAALEAAANAVLITDRAGKIIWVNRAFIEHTGYSFEEVRGKSPRLLKSGEQDHAFYEKMWKTILAGKVWRNTIINRRKDGTLNHEDLTIAPIRDATGTVTHFVGIKQDLTERKQAEEKARESEARYRSLFENMLEGVAYCQMVFENGQLQDFIYLDVNSAFETLTGLKNVVGKKISEVIPGIRESSPELFEIYGRVALAGKPERFEIYLEALGIWFSIAVYGTQKGYFVAVFDNITERKQAGAALEETNHKLETALNQLSATTQQLWQASKLATMGELAASIAHELNNPLATVGLRTETLLMQMPEDSDQRRPLEIIAQEVDRMATLVNNLLQFSRRSHRVVSTTDVREEITNSFEFVHYHLRTHKIEVTREFADSLPTIQADRQQLRQLFLNLLTNASDAMPEGGKLIVRAAPSVLDDAEAVAIEFADTGEGIAAENLEKIWDPFFTTKPEGKGTGLGLAICRRVVEEHGGRISIQSEAGRGTTVRIVLPATTNGSSG